MSNCGSRATSWKRSPPLCSKKTFSWQRIRVHRADLSGRLENPWRSPPANRAVLESGLREGAHKGVFGVGELEAEQPRCVYFKEPASISFAEREIPYKA